MLSPREKRDDPPMEPHGIMQLGYGEGMNGGVVLGSCDASEESFFVETGALVLILGRMTLAGDWAVAYDVMLGDGRIGWVYRKELVCLT